MRTRNKLFNLAIIIVTSIVGAVVNDMMMEQEVEMRVNEALADKKDNNGTEV